MYLCTSHDFVINQTMTDAIIISVIQKHTLNISKIIILFFLGTIRDKEYLSEKQ